MGGALSHLKFPKKGRSPSRVPKTSSDHPLETSKSLEEIAHTLEEGEKRPPSRRRKNDANRPRNPKGRERQRLYKGRVGHQMSSGPSAADSAYPNRGRSRPRRFRSRRKEHIDRPTATSRSKKRSPGRQRPSSQRSDSTTHDYHPSAAYLKLINRMCFDISLAIRGREEFRRFPPDAVSTTASIFVRFGIESFDEIRSTRVDQRSHFLADAKKSYRFKSTKLIREIFASAR